MTKVLGSVRVRSFGAARSATIEVHNSTGDVVDQVRTNDDGGFIYYLSPGTWAFRVWDAWGHRGRGEITLTEEDEATKLDLEIS
jgi:hypothetical protein